MSISPNPDGSWTVPVPVGSNSITLRFSAPPSPPTPPTPPAPPVTPPTTPTPWTAPYGIPEPSFGVREIAPAVPSPWTTEVAGFYCVDYASGSDARSRGTPAAPRKTIPAFLPAGSVVEVRGNYDHAPTGYSTISGSGTREAPIFIRGRAVPMRPVFRREVHIVGDHIILENIIFADLDGTLCGQPVLLAPAHHICLRDCYISGNKIAGGALLVSWDGQRGGDFVLLRCQIYYCGDWQIATDQDKHGVGVGNVDHVWILDCDIMRCSGDGVQINGGAAGQARTNHIYVGRCTAQQNKQTGFWCKQATDVVFSENVSRGHRPSPSTPNGAGMGFQYAPERVWFLRNDVIDCDTGIYTGSDSGLGSGSESFFLENKIYAIHSAKHIPNSSWSNGAALLLAGGKAPWVVMNQIDDCNGGIYSPNQRATIHLGDNVLTKIGPGHPELIDGARIAEIGALQTLRARYQSIHGVALT